MACVAGCKYVRLSYMHHVSLDQVIQAKTDLIGYALDFFYLDTNGCMMLYASTMNW